MNKGFIQIGNLVFVLFFMTTFLGVGYFYFFNNNKDIVAASVGESRGQGTTFKFIHPNDQYSLVLPYNWKNKYRVIEKINQTDFWYYEDDNKKDLLFSIIKQTAENYLTNGQQTKKLAKRGDCFYFLVIPDRTVGSLSPANSQLRREVLSVADTFSFLNKDQNELNIIQSLNQRIAATSSVKFSTFEIIATQENATTTEYFIWFVQKFFSFTDFRMSDSLLESMPAVVIFNKAGEVMSIKIPRNNANFSLDFKNIFPKSIRANDIFVSDSVENSILVEKLTVNLEEMIENYFGMEPIITQAGLIRGVTFDQAGLNLNISLLKNFTYSSTSLNSLTNISKATSQFFVSSSTPPIIYPLDLKNKLDLNRATSTQIFPVSVWPSIFGKNSTSTLVKKLFWFELQNGKVIRVYPI